MLLASVVCLNQNWFNADVKRQASRQVQSSSWIIKVSCVTDNLQLFGYMNMTLILGSPEYVMLPTVKRETLSTVLLTHITCTGERVRKRNKSSGPAALPARDNYSFILEHSDSTVEYRFGALMKADLKGPRVVLRLFKERPEVSIVVIF
jgi:hypothetical protein